MIVWLPRGMVGHSSIKMKRKYCHSIKARQENQEAEAKKSWAATGTAGTQSAKKPLKSLVKWAEMKREAGQVFPPPFFPMWGSRLT
jgi:hypothetical protein